MQLASNDRSRNRAPVYDEIKDSFEVAALEAYRLLGVSEAQVEAILNGSRERYRPEVG